MHKILATDDSVNACDCCGKSNLKFTFAVEVSGEVVHYGSTCVTKHTGRTYIQAKNEIAARETNRVMALERKYQATHEAIMLAARMIEARKLGLIGKQFKQFCAVERAAADAKRADIFA
ncbi:hypothetical protein [Ralstonia thomasii]